MLLAGFARLLVNGERVVETSFTKGLIHGHYLGTDVRGPIGNGGVRVAKQSAFCFRKRRDRGTSSLLLNLVVTGL